MWSTHACYIVIIFVAALLIYTEFDARHTQARQLQTLGVSIKQEAASIAQKDHVIDSLTKVQRKLDTVYLARKDTFAKVDSNYRAAKPLVFHDTVWVPKATADADVKACSLVVVTCEQRAAVAEARADSAAVAEDSAKAQAKNWKAVADGVTVAARRQKWQWGLIGYGAGSLSCNLLPLLHGR